MKNCKICEEIVEITEFKLGSSGNYGNICRMCSNNKRAAKNNSRQEDGTKLCCVCQNFLSVNKFYTKKEMSDGLQYACKDCIKQKVNNDCTPEKFIKSKLDVMKQACIKRSKCIECNVTYEELINLYYKQGGKCALSNMDMTHKSYNLENTERINYNISIDRIDSNKGYTIGNIQLVCAIVNIMKGDLTNKEFLLALDKIVEYNTPIIKN